MLIDYFLYNDEIELLQLRYNYSKDFVTKFVIAEGNYTFTGNKKEFSVEKHLKKCNIPIDQFLILKVDLSNEKLQITEQDIQRAKLHGSSDLNILRYFARHRIQRNSIKDILNHKITVSDIMNGVDSHVFVNLPPLPVNNLFTFPEPLFFLSDIDELFNYDKLETLIPVVSNYKNNYYVKIPLIYLENTASTRLVDKNNKNVLYDDKMVLCSFDQLKTDNPTDLRHNFTKNYSPIKINVDEKVDFNFGWLFHNMGKTEYKSKKYFSSLSSLLPNVDYTFSEDSKEQSKGFLSTSLLENVCFKTKPYDITHLPYEIYHYPLVKKFLFSQNNTVKKVDFVLYKDEQSLFRLRYKLLNDKIDLFIIVQGSTNFNGTYDNYKLFNKAYFKEFCNKHNFDYKKIRVNVHTFSHAFAMTDYDENRSAKQKFLDKSVIEFLDDNDKSKPWRQDNLNTRISYVREKILRNYLSDIIEEFDDSTVFISGDIDEIINPKYFDKIYNACLENPDIIYKIPLVCCEFRTDRRLINKDKTFVNYHNGLFACSKKPLMIATNTNIRDEHNLINDVKYFEEDLGWHLNWINSDSYNRIKVINHNFYNSIHKTYPISIPCLNYIESLVGNKISHNNIVSITEHVNDEEFIKYIANDDILCEFFLKDRCTMEQRLSYYKGKYNYIIENKNNLTKSFKTIFSYLPIQNNVIDYSANLGLALRAAFSIWGCEIKGIEQEKILLQNKEFVSLYENLDFNLKPYLNNFGNLKNFNNINFLRYIPVKLIDDFLVRAEEETKLETKYSLSICLDFAQYFTGEQSSILIDLITVNTESVLFSSANPKQYDFLYYNCQWQSHWIQEFVKRGFRFYEIRDKLLDLDFIPNNFKTNLLFFSKLTLDSFSEVPYTNLYCDNNQILEYTLDV